MRWMSTGCGWIVNVSVRVLASARYWRLADIRGIVENVVAKTEPANVLYSA